MKTKSHTLLGKYLITNVQGFRASKYEKAFLWGCIEPDFNLFTYLKGSIKVQKFKGHNFRNTENSVYHIIEKLQKSVHWGIPEYYRLGKLIHYISDAFTCPHNDNFRGNIKEHRYYEMMLHNCFKSQIEQRRKRQNKYRWTSVAEAVNQIHQRYLETAAGIHTDIRYIIQATGIVYQTLLPEPLDYTAAQSNV